MICYKDMTFCGFTSCIHFNTGCPRSLTEEVKKKANLINLPIAQYTEKPPCFIESPTTTGKLATVGIGDKASG